MPLERFDVAEWGCSAVVSPSANCFYAVYPSYQIDVSSSRRGQETIKENKNMQSIEGNIIKKFLSRVNIV